MDADTIIVKLLDEISRKDEVIRMLAEMLVKAQAKV